MRKQKIHAIFVDAANGCLLPINNAGGFLSARISFPNTDLVLVLSESSTK